jgi:hypothetical protein
VARRPVCARGWSVTILAAAACRRPAAFTVGPVPALASGARRAAPVLALAARRIAQVPGSVARQGVPDLAAARHLAVPVLASAAHLVIRDPASAGHPPAVLARAAILAGPDPAVRRAPINHRPLVSGVPPGRRPTAAHRRNSGRAE